MSAHSRTPDIGYRGDGLKGRLRLAAIGCPAECKRHFYSPAPID